MGDGGVVPTLNVFDNAHETRATVIVFYGNRVDDIRIQDDKINTLQARMGTGGNNMPMVFEPKSAFEENWAESEVKNALRANASKSSHAVVEKKQTVRRITPIECERLQGFPDNWTEGQPDTHRYKQMGNAVAVPVVEWIISNITMLE